MRTGAETHPGKWLPDGEIRVFFISHGKMPINLCEFTRLQAN